MSVTLDTGRAAKVGDFPRFRRVLVVNLRVKIDVSGKPPFGRDCAIKERVGDFLIETSKNYETYAVPSPNFILTSVIFHKRRRLLASQMCNIIIACAGLLLFDSEIPHFRRFKARLQRELGMSKTDRYNRKTGLLSSVNRYKPVFFPLRF